jgi:hypothetical protein
VEREECDFLTLCSIVFDNASNPQGKSAISRRLLQCRSGRKPANSISRAQLSDLDDFASFHYFLPQSKLTPLQKITLGRQLYCRPCLAAILVSVHGSELTGTEEVFGTGCSIMARRFAENLLRPLPTP